MNPVASPAFVASHSHGGSVRVVVATPPELSDTGEGGNTLRSLTQPRLFDAQPDGTWRASLVVPGSDHTSKDGKTATFKLSDAHWSDGSAITVADLIRTKDSRFVDRIDGPDSRGIITLHFKQKFPGWRQLWSDIGIAPPQPDVSGGPFVVKQVTSGKETVLERNPQWWGGPDRPYLDEVRLEYVPDSITARQLLQRGDVDMVSPRADSQRINQYKALAGVSTNVASMGGAWTALQFNAAGVPQSTRLPAAAAFPRDKFVNALLAGDATPYWSPPAISADKLNGVGLTISVPIENPMSVLLDRSLTSALADEGVNVNHRATDDATVTSLVNAKTYDVAFVTEHDGPDICWQCRFGDVDSSLAVRADSGDTAAIKQLQAKVRAQATMVPLWREIPLVAYRNGFNGVLANGYANTDAWDAESWWKS